MHYKAKGLLQTVSNILFHGHKLLKKCEETMEKG